MSNLARILAVVFLAAFAAGTAAHAAAATDMSLKMYMETMDSGMADCQDGPGDDGQASACDQFCATTLSAICPPAADELPHVAAIVSSLPAEPSGGRTGRPDPYPPRTTLLS
jgi:hypothetical protein